MYLMLSSMLRKPEGSFCYSELREYILYILSYIYFIYTLLYIYILHPKFPVKSLDGNFFPLCSSNQRYLSHPPNNPHWTPAPRVTANIVLFRAI